MSEKTIVITESEGSYNVQNNGLSEFELIGILESIVFEMKSARLQKGAGREPASPGAVQETAISSEETATKPRRGTAPPAASPDLRTRITNAVKAIKGLGGEAENTNLSNLTEEELQLELEELTDQYKRLKSSKAGK